MVSFFAGLDLGRQELRRMAAELKRVGLVELAGVVAGHAAKTKAGSRR